MSAKHSNNDEKLQFEKHKKREIEFQISPDTRAKNGK